MVLKAFGETNIHNIIFIMGQSNRTDFLQHVVDVRLEVLRCIFDADSAGNGVYSPQNIFFSSIIDDEVNLRSPKIH